MGKERYVKRVKKQSNPKMKYYIAGALSVVLIVGAVIGVMLFGGDSEKPKEATTGQTNTNTNQNDDPVKMTLDNRLPGYSISTSSTEASQAGAEVLEAGGNAADAAVAISYALSVTEPFASGIGGGGCMLIYDPDKEEYKFYNYASEAAQSGFSRDILIPGFVSGMQRVLDDYGTKNLSDLLQPAIRYCDGVKITEEFERRIERASGMLGTDSVFCQDGQWLREGETLVQPELKQTLETIASEGSEAFYSGSIADQLEAELGMPKSDLMAYKALRYVPVTSNYRDYEIVSSRAPYSGATLIQMLKMTEMLELDDPKEDNVGYLQKMEQATLAAHSNRQIKIYDYRFGKKVSQERMVSDEYIIEKLLNMDVSDVQMEQEGEDTTGFTVIDKNGMVVSCTNTLSAFFGARIEVGGFYINNSGCNFGIGKNAYENGKRPRTHIAPTILKKGDEVIAIATPGGNAIDKVLASVLVDMCRFGTDPQEAVDKCRILFQGNGLIYYETAFDTPLVAEVGGSGYRCIPVEDPSMFGNITLSGYSPTAGYYAVIDKRRNGEYRVKN